MVDTIKSFLEIKVSDVNLLLEVKDGCPSVYRSQHIGYARMTLPETTLLG